MLTSVSKAHVDLGSGRRAYLVVVDLDFDARFLHSSTISLRSPAACPPAGPEVTPLVTRPITQVGGAVSRAVQILLPSRSRRSPSGCPAQKNRVEE